jgi:polyphenol oxidase
MRNDNNRPPLRRHCFIIRHSSFIILLVLVRRTSETKVVWYESPLLAAAGVPHAFSTRIGGVSPPPFESLNLRNPSGCQFQDDYDRIGQNYQLLQAAIGLRDRPLLKLHQAHGRTFMKFDPQIPWDGSAKGDAIIVAHRGPIASVRVADCAPILLASEDGSAVAAVHAGWRGVVAGVVTATLAELRSLRPKVPVIAAIGPCIGMEAFEVGMEVIDCFEVIFKGQGTIRRDDEKKGRVDLRRAIYLELIASGLPEEKIDTTDRCTYRDADEFYSHRRDKGITGRMAALIATAV